MDEDFEGFMLFLMIILGGLILLVGASTLFYDEGQMDGYCKAVHGQVEDGNCVKGDTILKRGDEL